MWHKSLGRPVGPVKATVHLSVSKLPPQICRRKALLVMHYGLVRCTGILCGVWAYSLNRRFCASKSVITCSTVQRSTRLSHPPFATPEWVVPQNLNASHIVAEDGSQNLPPSKSWRHAAIHELHHCTASVFFKSTIIMRATGST